MSAYRSDNPFADFDRWDADQQEQMDRLPHCECCREPIVDYVWEIDGQILCEECAKEEYRKDAEDYFNETECD